MKNRTSSLFSTSLRTAWLAGVCLLAALPGARAKDLLGDPLVPYFYPPELLQSTHQYIGVSEEQGAKLRAEFDGVQAQVADLRQRIEAESAKMVELVKPVQVVEADVLAQAEKLFDLEREMKRMQLKLLVFLKNSLTPEQKARLDEIKKLDPKIRQVAKAIESRKAAGGDVSEIERLGEEARGLLEQGKTAEVEAILDRIAKMVEGAGS